MVGRREVTLRSRWPSLRKEDALVTEGGKTSSGKRERRTTVTGEHGAYCIIKDTPCLMKSMARALPCSLACVSFSSQRVLHPVAWRAVVAMRLPSPCLMLLPPSHFARFLFCQKPTHAPYFGQCGPRFDAYERASHANRVVGTLFLPFLLPLAQRPGALLATICLGAEPARQAPQPPPPAPL